MFKYLTRKKVCDLYNQFSNRFHDSDLVSRAVQGVEKKRSSHNNWQPVDAGSNLQTVMHFFYLFFVFFYSTVNNVEKTSKNTVVNIDVILVSFIKFLLVSPSHS
jgi:hypothetical protein